MQKILVPSLVSLFLSFSFFVSSLEARPKHKAGNFSYYTMALSWSPTYCATRRNRGFSTQCDSGRKFAFVLHGVWPQYNKGWPSYCRVRNNWIPKPIINSMLDIMPSKKLIIHEWKKHGVCSGLSPKGYYDLSRDLFKKIKIPARYITPQKPIFISPSEIESDFLKTNVALKADMISVACGRGRRLREVRICFDRQRNLTPCGVNENQRKLCRSRQIVMPPVR